MQAILERGNLFDTVVDLSDRLFGRTQVQEAPKYNYCVKEGRKRVYHLDLFTFPGRQQAAALLMRDPLLADVELTTRGLADKLAQQVAGVMHWSDFGNEIPALPALIGSCGFEGDPYVQVFLGQDRETAASLIIQL